MAWCRWSIDNKVSYYDSDSKIDHRLAPIFISIVSNCGLPFEKLPEPPIANIDPETSAFEMYVRDDWGAAERTIADNRDAGTVFGDHLIT